MIVVGVVGLICSVAVLIFGGRLDESLSKELIHKAVTDQPSNIPDPFKVQVSSAGHLLPREGDGNG
jgi:hypothetical protein